MKKKRQLPVFDAVPLEVGLWPEGDLEVELDRPLSLDEVRDLFPSVERDGEYS